MCGGSLLGEGGAGVGLVSKLCWRKALSTATARPVVTPPTAPSVVPPSVTLLCSEQLLLAPADEPSLCLMTRTVDLT